jgi:hypothetical protein
MDFQCSASRALETTERTHRELPTGPDLGDIKGIEAEFGRISLFWLHDLYMSGIRDVFSLLDGLPKVLFGVVGVDSAQLNGLLAGELLLAAIGEEVVLDVHEFAFVVDPMFISKLMAAGTHGSYHLKV